jgi:hypothetical protein
MNKNVKRRVSVPSDTLLAALDAHARDRCNCKPISDGRHDRCIVMLAVERIRELIAEQKRHTANAGRTCDAPKETP